MAHVVTSNCNACKFTDCVSVCPVDCFYEAEGQLVIHPEECIDCGACVPECPVEAIYEEYEVPDSESSFIEFNADRALNLVDMGKDPITDSQEPLPTAEDRRRALGF